MSLGRLLSVHFKTLVKETGSSVATFSNLHARSVKYDHGQSSIGLKKTRIIFLNQLIFSLVAAIFKKQIKI